MPKVVGASAFLNEFGVRNERVRILHWLARHGGAMALADVIAASTEPETVVMHKVASFVRDGFARCDVDLDVEDLGRVGQAAASLASQPSQVELTEQGRALLKYA